MVLDRAKQVLHEEAQALLKIADSLDENFTRAVSIMAAVSGKVIILGLGKSGLVGRKIAATLASTGTPSFFMHAAESLHGDIGGIDSGDVVMLLSYSGKTAEIARLLPALKKLGVPTIALTGDDDSEVAKNCDAVIHVNIEKEACPFNLAPTTSTTAMLAIGDALAITLLEKKGFKKEDFAERHPGGALGKKLLLKVGDIINSASCNPVIEMGSSVKDALVEMTRTRVGATCVVDVQGKLAGYFTDGDLRRYLQEDNDILDKKIDEVMTKNPRTVNRETLAINVREILKNSNFDNVPVIDEAGCPVGIIDERDIIREGL
jgi:arabinose-5-phosphate isomerase